MINSTIDGNTILQKSFVNLGIAVAIEPNGLIVPNIKGAEQLNLIGLAKAINDLAYRSRNKKLTPDDISGGTFSITNYGVFGTVFGTPIINHQDIGMASPEISQLGRYRIIELLGTGNYAAVYKAQDELLGRFVALKVLKDELASDNELLLRFNREARSLANLMHPHIAWVLDVGQIEGKYFLAMRYIEGETLDQVIKDRGKLSWSEALKITDEIGQALDFAHSKSVIHRDIKPKNILVSPKDGAVLTDFGLVKALDDINFRSSRRDW